MVGRFAVSKAGHDKAKVYVITAEEGDFVYLCDGCLKTLAKPKKKRTKHIQCVNAQVPQELLERLESGALVRNEEIKYAIKTYLEKQ
ncbi:MAG: hypothetical protein E7286_00975 [Lachnospiraceae bacterium]|nr:hypothetical protein [Lachnospiraceae bacterium]